MPYIDQKSRKRICDDFTGVINPKQINTAGEIQYAIAELLKSYMERNEHRYQTMNDVMGALSGAQMEFYRCVVEPYEIKKAEESGRVY